MAVNFLVPLVRVAFRAMFRGGRLGRLMNMLGGESDKGPQFDVQIQGDLAKIQYEAAMRSINGVTAQAWKNAEMNAKIFGANSAGRLAQVTPPLNGGMAKAEKNIEDDVNQIFVPLESVPFASLVLAQNWAAVKNYNFDFTSKKLKQAYDKGKMNVLYNAFAYSQNYKNVEPFEGGAAIIGAPDRAAHFMGRGKDGTPNGRKFYVVGPKDKAKAAIAAYSQLMKKNIGRMVGGWVMCYTKLGGKGLNMPRSLARKGIGNAHLRRTKDTIELDCYNKFGNFNDFMKQRYGTFRTVMDEEANRFKKSYVDFMKYESSKYIIKAPKI